MIITVSYTIKEVTRYRVVRKFAAMGGNKTAIGCSEEAKFGEFDRKEDAQRVVNALDRAAFAASADIIDL